MQGCCYNIYIKTMCTDTVKVLFIETLNPELKPQPWTDIATKKYKHVGGLWLSLGRIQYVEWQTALYYVELCLEGTLPLVNCMKILWLVIEYNYPVICLILWLANKHDFAFIWPNHTFVHTEPK